MVAFQKKVRDVAKHEQGAMVLMEVLDSLAHRLYVRVADAELEDFDS